MAQCIECGTAFIDRSPAKSARFCSSPCRRAFNNRRATRGAMIYDALMAMRYDRKAAKEMGVDYTFLCRIAELYRDEDRKAGRGQTWKPTEDMMDEYGPLVNARRGRV